MEILQPSVGSITYDHLDPAIHDSKADTEEIHSPFAEQAMAEASPAQLAETNGSAPLSDEMISDIARRVIERLSDRVIRDIAQEAVPRITEKLIREALDEERKR